MSICMPPTTSITTDASGRAQMTFTYGTTGRTDWVVLDSLTGVGFHVRVTAVGELE